MIVLNCMGLVLATSGPLVLIDQAQRNFMKKIVETICSGVLMCLGKVWWSSSRYPTILVVTQVVLTL